MDGLFEQLTNISKAHGYDILSEQVGELKKENARLREALKGMIASHEDGGNWHYNDEYEAAKAALKVTKFS